MVHTTATVREMQVEAVITRADGRVEHLGEVAYFHQSRVRRWLHACMRVLHG